MTDAERIVVAGGAPASFTKDVDFMTAANNLDGAIERVMRRLPQRGKKLNQNQTIATAKAEAGANPKRMQILERIHELPADVVTGLLNKRKQLVNSVLYTVSNASGQTTLRMVKTDSDIAPGISNLSKGKHDKYFLLQEIGFLYSNAADEFTGNYLQTMPPEMVNAVLDFDLNSKKTLENLPMSSLFSYDADRLGHINRYRLDNPKWIFKDTLIEAELKTDASNPLPAGFIKMLLFGQEVRDL